MLKMKRARTRFQLTTIPGEKGPYGIGLAECSLVCDARANRALGAAGNRAVVDMHGVALDGPDKPRRDTTPVAREDPMSSLADAGAEGINRTAVRESFLPGVDAKREAISVPRILVTDEDGLVRWSLSQALRRDGYEVLAVDSPAQTLEESLRGAVDVVITDSTFREFSGIDLLRAIKTSVPKTHVIMITADGGSRLERLARNIGAFDYFEKPFDVKAVASSVGRALATPERRRAPRA